MDLNKKIEDFKVIELSRHLKYIGDIISQKSKIIQKTLKIKDLSEKNVEAIQENFDNIMNNMDQEKELQYERMYRNFSYSVFYDGEEVTIALLIKKKEAIQNKISFLNNLLFNLDEDKSNEHLTIYLNIQDKVLLLKKKLSEMNDILVDFNSNN